MGVRQLGLWGSERVATRALFHVACTTNLSAIFDSLPLLPLEGAPCICAKNRGLSTVSRRAGTEAIPQILGRRVPSFLLYFDWCCVVVEFSRIWVRFSLVRHKLRRDRIVIPSLWLFLNSLGGHEDLVGVAFASVFISCCNIFPSPRPECITSQASAAQSSLAFGLIEDPSRKLCAVVSPFQCLETSSTLSAPILNRPTPSSPPSPSPLPLLHL